jgi:hypothetical protein
MMHKTCRPTVRTTAAVGTAVAMIAMSSAFGVGATAAVADDAATTATSPATAPATSAPATSTPTADPTAPATDQTDPTKPAAADPTATPTASAPSPADAPTASAPAPADAPSASAPAPADAPSASAPAPAADADATPAGTVTISGTLRAWHTISADTAGWPAGTTFTYRWAFHHPVVIDTHPGTDRSYIVDPEQADGTFAVTVTGTAPGKTPTSVTSAESIPVVVEDSDLQYVYGQRVVHVTRDEPFSVDVSPSDNPDLSFYANGSSSGAPDPRVLPEGVTLSDDGMLSGTLATGTTIPAPIWVHVSTPLHPGGGLSERLVLDASPSANPLPLSFTGGATPEQPVELDAQAGKPFSHAFRTSGGTGEPVRYEVRLPVGATLPAGITFDPTTGVLSGTTTVSVYSSLSVVATSGSQTAVQYAELRVAPGRAVGLRVTVSRPGDPQQRTWTVEPDGSEETMWFPKGLDREPERAAGERPTVAQGGTLRVAGAPVDAWGNITVPLDGDWEGRTPLIVTSDVSSDVAKRVDWFAEVSFPHASTHTLTATAEGVSTTFRVTVVPTAGTTGSLAFTGADETGPLAWALGLLASGAALLLVRLRRRRA